MKMLKELHSLLLVTYLVCSARYFSNEDRKNPIILQALKRHLSLLYLEIINIKSIFCFYVVNTLSIMIWIQKNKFPFKRFFYLEFLIIVPWSAFPVAQIMMSLWDPCAVLKHFYVAPVILTNMKVLKQKFKMLPFLDNILSNVRKFVMI